MQRIRRFGDDSLYVLTLYHIFRISFTV